MDFNDSQCSEEKSPVKMSNIFEPLSEPLITIPDAKYENGKISSLSIIALEYSSNSDVEEIEADTNKTENQNITPIANKENEKKEIEKKQTLQQYRTIEEIALEYSSNLDVEEIEADTNKTENQNTMPIAKKENVKKQILQQYRTIEEIALECNSNSDVEEIEADTNKTENQNTMPIANKENEKKEIEKKQTLQQYRTIEEFALEYSSNSDVEEIEAATNKTENQNTMPNANKENEKKEIEKEQTLQQYRTIKENILSSCDETDSEDDSSSSCDSSSSSSTNNDSSSSDSDSDDITSTNNNKKKKGNKAGIIKKKRQIENEFNDLPPIEDLKISVPEVLCDILGKIDKVVEQLVIVKPNSDKPTLHIDTVLFVEKGERALGKILDVFGPVSEPNYCIRFNSPEHIQESNIKVGMSVYYCPNTQYTSLIFLHELHKMKSYDAVVDDEPAFSDDEEERAYYEMLKQKNNKDSSDGSTSRKRQRMSSFTQDKPTAEWQSNHPWNRNAKFQKNQTKGQQLLKNNSHFNLSQYRPYSYNDSWMQYQHQNNMHWPPVPRNMHPIFNRSNAEYRPPFNESGLPQYGNYNSNNSGDGKQYFQGATPNSQCNNMQPQYSRIPFDAPPRFNPMFPPSLPMSYSQLPNASFSYIDMSYPISVRPHTNALWPSLPPPPPPSKDSMTID